MKKPAIHGRIYEEDLYEYPTPAETEKNRLKISCKINRGRGSIFEQGSFYTMEFFKNVHRNAKLNPKPNELRK